MRTLLLAALLVGTGACDGRPDASDSPIVQSSLKADSPEHDFGRVHIDGGVVGTVFRVVNEGSDDVRLMSVSTSCGCTTALAEFSDGSTVGSFDVPNGGAVADVGRVVGAGEAFQVRVEFDPAAHGPDGTGQLLREVILAMPDGSQTRLMITADVFRG